MTIHAYALLGNEVSSAAWNWGPSNVFQEVGGGNWRVSFVPDAAKIVRIETVLKPAIGGSWSGYTRLVMKARIVRIAPSPENNLAIHAEDKFEYNATSGLRWREACMSFWVYDTIPNERVSLTHTYAVELWPYEGVGGSVNYGSLLGISD